MLKSEIIDGIDKISQKKEIDVEKLSEYLEELKEISANDRQIAEMVDIFPALEKYKIEHSIINLQKLCVEISEFCRAVYASTQNDEERKVYDTMLDRLKKH